MRSSAAAGPPAGGKAWWAFVLSTAAVLASEAGLTAMANGPGALFFVVLASFAVAGYVNDGTRAMVAWGIGAAGLGVCTWLTARESWAGDALLTLAFATTMWLAGHLVARRTRRAALMAQRAADAQEAGEAAVREQRAQIARELHDVVSHGLAVVVIQTEAARAVLADGGPGPEVDRHLAAVDETAREALDEMRRMLGLLRAEDWDDPKGAETDPSPVLAQAGSLVDRARAAGLDVDDTGLEAVTEVSPGLGVMAYRIIQEGLTNALKHHPGGHATVTAARVGDVLRLAIVSTPGPRSQGAVVPGAGVGLRGLQERVGLYGGTLHAGPEAGGFALRVSFPCAANVLQPLSTGRLPT